MFQETPDHSTSNQNGIPMCSILGVFDFRPGADVSALRALALAQSACQRHRGPDWSGVHATRQALLVHERLAIVDPAGGAQPLLSGDGALALAVNGEIYNHRELLRELKYPYDLQSASDCEVINAVYRDGDTPVAWLDRLNGIYAFALWDDATGRLIVARDPLGVCPLYWGHDGDGRLVEVNAAACTSTTSSGASWATRTDSSAMFNEPSRPYSRPSAIRNSVDAAMLKVT